MTLEHPWHTAHKDDVDSRSSSLLASMSGHDMMSGASFCLSRVKKKHRHLFVQCLQHKLKQRRVQMRRNLFCLQISRSNTSVAWFKACHFQLRKSQLKITDLTFGAFSAGGSHLVVIASPRGMCKISLGWLALLRAHLKFALSSSLGGNGSEFFHV